MQVDIKMWSQILQDEYLDDFIRQGGAAVKFVLVPHDEAADDVFRRVKAAGEQEGYVICHVDASRVKVHQIQYLFHEVARQIPWEDLATRVVRKCYAELGYQVDTELRFNKVAETKGEEPGPLGTEMRRTIQGLLKLSDSMVKDFRYAMLWMCMEKLRNPSAERTDTDVILEWLRGDIRLMSSLKKLLIFRKISRHNAREMLSSLGAWCRLAGYPGLVLTLDIRQFIHIRKEEVAPGALHYSGSAIMDAYEVLRQLIDGIDELTGIMCVVIAPPDLIDDEKRGVKVYKALYERIWPDVRLRSRANPLSALTRVEVHS